MHLKSDKFDSAQGSVYFVKIGDSKEDVVLKNVSCSFASINIAITRRLYCFKFDYKNLESF